MTAVRLHRALLYMLACMSVLHGHAQFVTLEGRRFMLNGQEFYPVVLNYGIEFMSGDTSISEPDSMYYSPSNQHGTSVDIFYECNGPGSCDQQLRTELAQVAALGFNTIRLVGTNARAFRTSSGDRPYKMKVSPIDPYVWSYHVDLSAPDFSDPMSERHFYLIEQILNAADDVGLKVILLTGTEVKTWPESEDQVIYDATDAQNYSAYLHALASHLHDHPALLAYDVLNEPAWRDFNDNIMDLSKADVCEWTGWWYDTLTAADPNHLVTLGGHSIHEIGAWDPAVMKIDFYSPHLYLEGDWDFAGIYNMDEIIDKYMAELYWLGATLEMPWIVGETSFTADDDTTDYGGNTYLDGLPEHHAMPWMHGSEAVQAAFAAETMAATRAYGGSGWSWWYYQNGRSTRYNEVFPGGKTHRDLRSNYFGVLSFGHDNDPGRVKPMAAEVQAYQPEPLPDELPEPPPAYWNWHGLTSNVYRTYHLQDQNQEPVANGVALLLWKFPNSADPGDFKPLWARYVSDSNGTMVIYEPDTIVGFLDPVAGKISVDAAGAARESNEPLPWLNDETITLERDLMTYSRTLSGLEINNQSASRHSAWAELTILDSYVSASGTTTTPVIFEARHWVSVQGEFHIDNASEAQIRTARTFPDCSNPYLGMIQEQFTSGAGLKRLREKPDANVNLNFARKTNGVSAFPNPCIDKIIVESDDFGILTVLNAQGVVLYQGKVSAGMSVLDASTWAEGVYLLNVNHQTGVQSIKLVKLQ